MGKQYTKGAIIIEGHVQGLSMARSLGKLGIPVTVVDKNNCIARYSKYVDKFFICPEFNSDTFADFLIELAVREKMKGWILLPSNDHAVITLSRNQNRLNSYYKMLVPSYDKLEIIYNKSNLLHLAIESDIAVPDTICFVDSNVDDIAIKFPVITKGKHGLSFYRSFKRKGFVAKDKTELNKQLKFIQSGYDLSDTFTQTIISSGENNKTISFTAFCEDGIIKTYWMGRKLREHPIKFGTATLAESIYELDLIERSQKLLIRLNYTGVCEIEYLKDPLDGKYKLIEINARTWLWVGLATKCGIDYPVYIYNYLNSIPNYYPESYSIGLKWKNGITDLVFSLFAICQGLLSIKTYFRQLKGEKVSAILYKGDNLPALMYSLMLFSYLRKR